MPRKLPRPHERLKIDAPCSAEWDSMAGNERVRFCAHCSLHVHNLSEITPAQALALVRRSGGRLCLRVERPPGGLPRTLAQPLYQIRRRASRLAAGAFGAALTLCTTAAAQAQSSATELAQPTVREAQRAAADGSGAGGSASLGGRVVDPIAAAVPGARVVLKNNETGAQFEATTDGEGANRFGGLAEGTYTLSVAFEGFSTAVLESLKVQAGPEQRADVSLQLDRETVTVGVVVVAVEPSEPLVKAARENDLEAVRRLLLFESADVNAVDENVGLTALAQAYENGNREIARELLWRGASVNKRLSYRQTALMRVTEGTKVESVRDLLDAGARVNLRDEDGNTALIFAAGRGRQDVVELLLRAGAKVNARNKEGYTALMSAAASGSSETVRALLLAGADVGLRDDEGHSALWYARDNGADEAASLLLAFGAYEEPEENRR